jgi:hypothetical protein
MQNNLLNCCIFECVVTLVHWCGIILAILKKLNRTVVNPAFLMCALRDRNNSSDHQVTITCCGPLGALLPN